MKPSASKLAALAILTQPQPERKPPVATPRRRCKRMPESPLPPKPRANRGCTCGLPECLRCRKRAWAEMRRESLAGLGNKWSAWFARNADEEAMCRMKLNRNWPGPDPSPPTSSALLIEAAVYAGGLPRSGRVRMEEP